MCGGRHCSSDFANSKRIALNTFYLAIFGKFFDLWQRAIQGAIYALERQIISSTHTIVAYWLINLPLSILVVWPLGAGYSGLWYCINGAWFYLAIVQTCIIH